jgi:hypothetical protein
MEERLKELLNGQETKTSCHEINQIIVNLGGPNTNSCFCTRVQRHEFFKEAFNWYTEHKKSKGLGDTIEKITQFFGVESCDACKLRRDFLNTIFKYK